MQPNELTFAFPSPSELLTFFLFSTLGFAFFVVSVLVPMWFVLSVLLQRLLMPKTLRQLVNEGLNDDEHLPTSDEKLVRATLLGLSPLFPLTVPERIRVIELAGRLRVKEATQSLIKLLKRFPMWEEVYAKAIWALGEIGDERVAPEIAPYLGNFNHPAIREAASEALSKLGWGEFVEAFNSAMTGDEEAITVLRKKYRQEAVKVFVKALWANENSTAVAAAKALGNLNAVEALGELKRRSSLLQSPKEVREVCREVAAKLEQFSRLPSLPRFEIDTSTLPRPATPSQIQTETLPSLAKPPEQS